jgi:hypothetical protein
MPLSIGIASGAGSLKNPAEPRALGYRVNLVPNPSFEVNADDWFATTAATVARSTDESLNGSASLRVVTTAAGNGAQYGRTTSPFTKLPYNDQGTYIASAYVKTEVGSASATYVLRYFEYENQTSTSTVGSGILDSKVVADGDGWVRLDGSWTRTGIANYVIIRIQSGSAVSGNAFFIDNVLVEESNTLGSYFDGDVGFWSGTPHDSISGGTPY